MRAQEAVSAVRRDGWGKMYILTVTVCELRTTEISHCEEKRWGDADRERNEESVNGIRNC